NTDTGGLAVFKRSHDTGVITQLAGTKGCLNEDNDVDGCDTNVVTLQGVSGVVVSADQAFVYAVENEGMSGGGNGGGSSAFERGAQGELTQLAGTAGCMNTEGDDGCGTAKGMDGAEQVVASADGLNLYATGEGDGTVARFVIDASGGLTQPAGMGA